MYARPRYLDPTNDFTFKRVFRDKIRLIKFLNAIMRLSGERQIADLTYISQEQVPELMHRKSSLVDIKCEDKAGKVFIVEMQNGYQQYLLKRLQFYAANAYTSQLGAGDSYNDLMPVFVIVLLRDQIINPDIPIISYHKSREETTGQHIFTDISHVIVELKKFTKTEDELSSEDDYWLYFLSKWAVSQGPPKRLQDEVIKTAYDQIEAFSFSEAEYKAYLDAKTLAEEELANLEVEYKRGKTEGRAEGRAEGLAQRSLEFAQSMLADNEPIDKIKKWTGLSEEQINTLKEAEKVTFRPL
ncbi:MAG: Rpn family recombination-promoting nuclease/putative transposase [Bacteroidota bacterium]